MSYFEAYVEPSIPEHPTDVPIMVPTPPINEPVTELVPIEEDHLVMLPRNNQGWGVRMATVHSGQHACRGGHSYRQGYGGVAHM